MPARPLSRCLQLSVLRAYANIRLHAGYFLQSDHRARRCRRFEITARCAADWRGVVCDDPDKRRGPDQYPVALHTGSFHVSADGRSARCGRAWGATRRRQPGAVFDARHHRNAGVCCLADSPARHRTFARPDRRLSHGLSVGCVSSPVRSPNGDTTGSTSLQSSR